MNTTDKIGDRRVAVCQHTGVIVLQEYKGMGSKEYGGWLHLHNDSILQDKAEALAALQLNPELDREASRTK